MTDYLLLSRSCLYSDYFSLNLLSVTKQFEGIDRTKMFDRISRLKVRSLCGIRHVLSRYHSSVIIETEYGPIKGDRKSSVLGRNYFNFQGIPYMKAPLGKLRFRDAQAPEKWSEPLDVTKSPPGYCMRQFLNYKDGGQEDAAILNVYTPQVTPKKPLPTMVWIHGGGWNSGSGQPDLFGCDYLMQVWLMKIATNIYQQRYQSNRKT